MNSVRLGNFNIDNSSEVFVVAEIGINHNGELSIAENLIRAAADSGANAVKMQKRNPEVCVPDDQKNLLRQTPWGTITYLEYRHRMEFSADEYRRLADLAHSLKLEFFASPWDIDSLEFLLSLNHNIIKIASASLTDDKLLLAAGHSGASVVLSTGMSNKAQISHAVDLLGSATNQIVLCHSTSTYPCQPEELNLRVIQSFKNTYDFPVGYSGHEVGLVTSAAAVALGARLIERHITLDRTMWGSDHAASVEPAGFERLVRYIRTVERSLGDGDKKVYESEIPSMRKLRRF